MCSTNIPKTKRITPTLKYRGERAFLRRFLPKLITRSCGTQFMVWTRHTSIPERCGWKTGSLEKQCSNTQILPLTCSSSNKKCARMHQFNSTLVMANTRFSTRTFQQNEDSKAYTTLVQKHLQFRQIPWQRHFDTHKQTLHHPQHNGLNFFGHIENLEENLTLKWNVFFYLMFAICVHKFSRCAFTFGEKFETQTFSAEHVEYIFFNPVQTFLPKLWKFLINMKSNFLKKKLFYLQTYHLDR